MKLNLHATTKRRRKGDLGGPIIALLLAVAGLAIAGGVIAYMMGYVGSMKKPVIDTTSVYLYNESNNWVVEFTIDTTGSGAVKIKSVKLFDDNGGMHETNTIKVEGKETSIVPKDMQATVKAYFNDVSGDSLLRSTHKVIIETDKGTFKVTAESP